MLTRFTRSATRGAAPADTFCVYTLRESLSRNQGAHVAAASRPFGLKQPGTVGFCFPNMDSHYAYTPYIWPMLAPAVFTAALVGLCLAAAFRARRAAGSRWRCCYHAVGRGRGAGSGGGGCLHQDFLDQVSSHLDTSRKHGGALFRAGICRSRPLADPPHADAAGDSPTPLPGLDPHERCPPLAVA